jgi:hypothetical protein
MAGPGGNVLRLPYRGRIIAELPGLVALNQLTGTFDLPAGLEPVGPEV